MRSDDIDIAATLFTQPLGRNAILLCWDGRHPGESRHLSVRFDGTDVPRSRATTSLPVTDHGQRHLVAITLPRGVKGGTGIEVSDAKGRTLAIGRLAETERPGEAGLNTTRLLQGCLPMARLRLARFIIEVAAATLRLERDPVFIANVRALLEMLCRAPGLARARADIADRWILCDGTLKAGVGDRLAAVLLTEGHLRILSPAPAKDDVKLVKGGRRAFNFLVPADLDGWAGSEPPSVVVFGEQGLAWRQIEGLDMPRPTALDWLDPANTARSGARRYVVAMLARDGRCRQASAAALREIEVAGSADGARALVGLAIDAAIATPAGLFVSGCIADRLSLAVALEFSAPGWAGATTISGLHCSAAAVPGDERPFVALIAGEGTLPQESRIGITVRLGSGMALDAGTVLASLAGLAAERALGAAIPAAARAATIAEVFSPALDAIRTDAGITVERVDIGDQPGAPRAEIVFAYPEDAMLRAALFSSLAVDPAMREMSLGLWLRQPEDVALAERALRVAQTVYGLAFHVYAPAAASGSPASDAECLNAIVAQVPAEIVVLVDGGLLPSAAGWAEALLGALEGPAPADAACGLIIDSDGSIRHAGFALARMPDGLPVLDQPLAGFPAGQVGAGKPATADALPAACLALRRPAFLQVGGFASGYLTRAYRDADLSLRLRAVGFDLACVTKPAMIAFGADVTHASTDAWALADRQTFARSWAAWLDGGLDEGAAGSHRAADRERPRGNETAAADERTSEPVVRFRRRRWAA
ncbi:MAG: hypothetical protein U1E97_01065 [Alphaproteobacteria bacterium]